MYIAQADVKNCFYQIELPEWLRPYFTLPSITRQEAISIGLVDENYDAGDGDRIFPCLAVVPMGWSWAFWLVQKLHEHGADSCGFGVQKRLVASWPVPNLERTTIAMPSRLCRFHRGTLGAVKNENFDGI